MTGPTPKQPEIVRVTPALLPAAAGRLVAGPGVDTRQAGRQFLARAKEHGVELKLFWSAVAGREARQSALIVPQAGRTAMVFLSPVGPARVCGDRDEQNRDRIAVLTAAMEGAAAELGDGLHLIQALPAPEEWWASEAFAGAGMRRLGELAYLRRPLSRRPAGRPPAWPDGVDVAPVRGLGEGEDGPALRTALERSYIDTLDCPGLCELREIPDVVESHRATGEFDPGLWWIVRCEGEPQGCVLLNPSPEQDSVELVYIGLGPALRGRGLARGLMEAAIGRVGHLGLGHMSCAVDQQNEPARLLYAKLGFTEFAKRTAFVHPTR